MNKKLGVCLALACAMCFTAALAACGDKKNDDDNNDAIVPDTTKVTEEVWKQQAAVFATATNFTLDRVSVETGKSVGMMKLDGAVYYEAWGDEEGVYTLENGTYYHYTKEDASSAWEKDTTTQSRYEDRIQTPKMVITYAAEAVAEIYSSFTFDEKTGVYSTETVSIAEGYVTLNNVEIIMSSGKIAKVECTYEDGFEGDGDERVTIDHIGTTKIEIPKVSGGDSEDDNPTGGQTVGDAKAWTAAINASAENFTLNTTISYEGMTVPLTMKVAGDKYEQNQSFMGMNISVFIEKEGDVYVTYEPYGDGSVWERTTEKSAESGEAFEATKALVNVLADHYDAFTLKDGKYVCAALDLTINGSTAHATNIEADFTAGKLVSLSYHSSIEEDGTTTEQLQFTFSNFGSTTVTLPTKYIDEDSESGGGSSGEAQKPTDPTNPGGSGEQTNPGGQGGQGNPEQVDEKVWNNVFTEAAENFTLEMTAVGDDSVMAKLMIDGNNLKVVTDGTYVIAVEEGDSYAGYTSKDGDTWVKEADPTAEEANRVKEEIAEFRSLVNMFADHYSDFTYQDGKYVCNQLTIDLLGESVSCTEIEATIEGRQLVSLTYIIRNSDMQITVSLIGATIVEAPKI